ncbi:MAG: hypothetical protein JWO42_890 [Chloroflexi bacterium]|nr:hypothetical protein [Chloroflexota bacterium]
MDELRATNNNATIHRWVLAFLVILTLLAGTILVEQLYRLFASFGDVVRIYFTAWILQFLLSPIVDWLSARGLKRGYAAAIVYLGILVVIIALLVLTMPYLLTQLRAFATWLIDVGEDKLPHLTANVDSYIQTHAPNSWKPGLISAANSLSTQITGQLRSLSGNVSSTSQTLTTAVASQTLNVVNTTLSTLVQWLIIFVLSFFMTTLGRQFVRGGMTYLPRSLYPDVEAVIKVINHAFGGFIRGQIVLSTIYSIAIFVVLEAFANIGGHNTILQGLAVVAAILAGLIMIVPVIGTTLSMVPPILIGAFALQDLSRTLALVIIVWAIQLFMANYMGPRVMSEAVGINALWTFGGLLIGGKLGGILGAFFSVPILAVILAIAERIYLHLPHSKERTVTVVEPIAEPQLAPNPKPMRIMTRLFPMWVQRRIHR